MAENNGDPEYKQSSFIPDSTSSDLVKEQRQWLENKRRQAGPSRSPEPRDKKPGSELSEQYRLYDQLQGMKDGLERAPHQKASETLEEYYKRIGYKPISPEQKEIYKKGLDSLRRDSQDN